MIPLEERQAMRERCDAATKEPWTAEHTNVFAQDRHDNHVTVLGSTSIPYEERVANASHQAHARTDLPACLDDLDEAENKMATFAAALRDGREIMAQSKKRIAELEHRVMSAVFDLAERDMRIVELEGVVAWYANHPAEFDNGEKARLVMGTAI